MKVPIVDLVRQHGPLKEEIGRAVANAVANGAFVGGPEVEAFEREYAEYLGATDVVGVSTGTAALHLALRALDLSPTDEVVVPANSFIATAEAVVLAGATPVFCDVDEETGLATAETMNAVVTERTRVLVPVHLYGHVVDMAPVLQLAETHQLYVVEDAAQAHGARYLRGEGARAGAMGHAAGFSFYPAKNLGAIGEGGACAVADPELAARVRMLRDHGQSSKHVHETIGDNGRLPAIQAAALRIKLRRLDEWNHRRREIAATYTKAFDALDLRVVREPAWSESVYHQYVVRVASREEWIHALAADGVSSAVHYPTPIHLQPAFAPLGYGPGSLPGVEAQAGEVLSLPIIPELSDAEVAHVVRTVAEVAGKVGSKRMTFTGTDDR